MGWAPKSDFTGLWTFAAIFWCIVSRDAEIKFSLLGFAPLILNVDTIFWTLATGLLCFLLLRPGERQSPLERGQLRATARSQVRAVSTTTILLLCCIWTLTLFTWTSQTGLFDSLWSEGCVRVMADMGTGLAPVKTHDEELRLALEPNQPFRRNTTIQKRSFRRALNRVQKHGFTWYRGRMISGQVSSTPTVSTPSKGVSNNVKPPGPKRRKRLSCFSWNAGGMSPSDWDHFQMWTCKQPLDVICIQETHWQFTSEWAQDRYFCIHSGMNKSQAGVLTMISKSICAENDISWQEPIPGRLLHVRLFGLHKNIDILNLYQHVHAPKYMMNRHQFWNTLHETLSSLPNRNTWLMMGDLNTSLQIRNAAVGLEDYHWQGTRRPGPRHTDADHLNNLLNIYNLVALNTWKHTLGPTYQFEQTHSRIDYIILKRHLTDASARDVHYLHDFPLKGLTGAQHVPLVCNVLKVWTPSPQDAAPGWSRAQRRQLYMHWRANDSLAHQLHASLQQDLAQLPAHAQDRLHEVHSCMNQVRGQNFQSKRPSSIYTYDLSPFRAFQFHTQRLRELSCCSATKSVLLQAWQHVSKRQRARREMNQASKASRSRRLQLIYDNANKAETAKDPFQFYQCIRELAPKLPFKRIQLRSDTGELLGPAAAADELHAWFRDLYNAEDTLPTPGHGQWPFTHDELNQGLLHLPAFKALDPQYAPAPLWKLMAEDITHYLHPFFDECFAYGQLPSCWGRDS